MILVYPIGITAMYAYLLIINRVAIMDEETREDNEGIRYLVFLWRSYQGRYWWFEIYENIRRLSLTALLVWFPPGSVGQMATAMIVVLFGVKMYTFFRPYCSMDENVMAEVSQWSIFVKRPYIYPNV